MIRVLMGSKGEEYYTTKRSRRLQARLIEGNGGLGEMGVRWDLAGDVRRHVGPSGRGAGGGEEGDGKGCSVGESM